MRFLTAAIFLALCATVLPVSAEPNGNLLQDAAGDVAFSISGSPGPDIAQAKDGLDLQSLALAESDSDLTVLIAADSLDGQASYADRFQLNVTFVYEQQPYLIQCGRTYLTPATRMPIHDCNLYTVSGTEIRNEGQLNNNYDGTWTIQVPLRFIRGLLGTPFLQNHAIENWVVESYRHQTAASRDANGEYTGHIYATDRMPDVGTGLAYLIQKGEKQSSQLYIVSDQPIRYSNGEARTYVFNFTTTYAFDQPGEVIWTTAEVPRGWEVIIPSPKQAVDGRAVIERTAIARVPFMHQHGTEAKFRVEAHTDRDMKAIGATHLGVLYPAVPQPAGHHDTLFVHGQAETDQFGASFLSAYMNTLSEDPAGIDGQPIPAQTSTTTPLGSGSYLVAPGDDKWSIPLNPGLLVGLFFIPEGDVHFEGIVQAGRAQDNVRIESLLVIERPGPDGLERQMVANGSPLDIGQILPGDQFNIGGPFALHPDISIIPGLQDWNLVLEISMIGSPTIGANPATLLPGAYLDLPLLDPVDVSLGVSEPVADVAATLSPGNLLRIQPGLEDEFVITAKNLGTPRAVTIEVLASQDWTFEASEFPTLLPTGETPIHIGVAMPADAIYGDQVDIIVSLAIENQGTPILIRMVAIADGAGTGVESVERIDTPGKEAPSFEFLPILSGLLAMAMIRRRIIHRR